MAPKAKRDAKLLTENETTIAYSLRSRDVMISQTGGTEGQSSRSSKKQKEKSSSDKKIKTKKTNKTNINTSIEKQDHVGTTKEKEKNNEKSINEQRMYYIRWNGDVGKTFCNCSLCGKDLSNIDGEREYEVQYYHLSSLGQDESSSSNILPESVVLPCSHVFHETCFSKLPVTNVTNPPCPICPTTILST